jgi:hypothetical protein
MLIKNIDVADDVDNNGSQGQIVPFIKSWKGETVAIAVKIDAQSVGQAARRESPYMFQLKEMSDSTLILKVETSFTVTRKKQHTHSLSGISFL